MKNITVLLVLLVSLRFPAISQSSLQLSVSGGPTFTSNIEYNNSTGHINAAITGSLGLIYRPNSVFGIEFKISSLANPTSYLNNDTSNTVKIYTTSQIVFQRILAGLNYYLPLKSIKPFIGLIGGASYVEENRASPYSSLIKFNWGFQIGASININKILAVRLDACEIYIPNVPNNSTFFGDTKDDSGFPSFIIGNPSSATITQWNIDLGLLINLSKTNK
jgi:hypothetical protein